MQNLVHRQWNLLVQNHEVSRDHRSWNVQLVDSIFARSIAFHERNTGKE